MIELKFNKDILRNHFTYSKFIYIGAIIGAVVLFNLVYSMTEPQMPEENKVDIYSYCGYGNETNVDIWEIEMLELLDEDQREVNIVSTTYMDTMAEIIVARMAASEGDLILLSNEHMTSLMESYAFIPLEDYIDKDTIEQSYPEIDWSLYTYDDSEGTEHIYMLPLDEVKGLYELDNMPENCCIALFHYSQNTENALTCLDYIMSQTQYDGEIPQAAQ